MRQTWESGAERCGLGAAEDPGRKEGERREGQRAVRWQRAVSDFWRRPVRDRKRALQEGRWGRSREVPGGHVLLSGRSPRPPPDPATALQVRLLTLKSCRSDEPPPAPSSSQLSRALHLPFPRHPPHTHSLGPGTPLEGSTQGRGKRAAKSEVSG